MTNQEFESALERTQNLSPDDRLLILRAAHDSTLTEMEERHLVAISNEDADAYFRRKRRGKMRGDDPVAHRPVSVILSECHVSTVGKKAETHDEGETVAPDGKKDTSHLLFWQVLHGERLSEAHQKQLEELLKNPLWCEALWCAAGVGEGIRAMLVAKGYKPPSLQVMFDQYRLDRLPAADRHVVVGYVQADVDPSDAECKRLKELRKYPLVEVLFSAELDCSDR